MNIEQLRYEADEELREEEAKEIKEEMKETAVRKYHKKKLWGKFLQNIKCIFGRHVYNRIPSLGIATCPCCTRIWNNPYQGLNKKLNSMVNGSIVGYDDYEADWIDARKPPRLKGDK